MDGVSSIFAVISLAIQVLEAVHKTSGFVKDIQDAPSELIKLSESLNQLELVLQEVNLLLQQRYLVLRLPGSPMILLRALEECERRIKPLQVIVQEAKGTMKQENRAQRTWASFKLVTKKERLRELQTCLRDAKLDLSTAMSVNSSQIQMHHLQITIDSSRKVIESIGRQPRIEASSTATSLENSQTLQSRRKGHEQFKYSVVQKKTIARYKGIFGAARIDTETKSSATLLGFQATIQDIQLKVTSIVVTPKILQRRFEMFIKNHLGQISRTLSVYPVVSSESSFFQMCRDGDIPGIQAALDEGGMTPFVLDGNGFTSLHWAAQGVSPKLCLWLLGQGLDPDRRSDYGTKAMDGLGKSLDCIWNGRRNLLIDGRVLGTDALVDTLRILGQAQKEVSALDMECMWYLFGGPAHDVELLYRQWSIVMELQQEDSQLTRSHVLTKALWQYGRGRLEWEYLVRKMVRSGVDLHGRVCHAYIDEPMECYTIIHTEEERQLRRKDRRFMHGTPLDELFKETVSPYEAVLAAENWFSILRSEGLDVIAYLEEELALHAAQQQLTYSGHDGTTRRQLVFNFSATPTVWWEWLLDHESGAYLVREEFKGMYTLWEDHESLGLLADPVRDVSPFDYPDWSFERMPNVTRKEDIPLDWIYRMYSAEDRLERRWKRKAAKLARAQRTKGPRKIPGAWPT